MVLINRDLIKTTIQILKSPELKNITKFDLFGELIQRITDKRSAPIIYCISKLKFSTPQEIKKYTHILSRDTIHYHVGKLINLGLIDTIGSYSRNYEMYHDFWKTKHNNTHSEPMFYITTKLLDEIVENLDHIFSCHFKNAYIKAFEKRGIEFDAHLKEKEAEKAAMETAVKNDLIQTIGVCCECERIIQQNKNQKVSYEFFEGKLYCKSCIKEMGANGTLSEILKQKKAKVNQ